MLSDFFGSEEVAYDIEVRGVPKPDPLDTDPVEVLIWRQGQEGYIDVFALNGHETVMYGDKFDLIMDWKLET